MTQMIGRTALLSLAALGFAGCSTAGYSEHFAQKGPVGGALTGAAGGAALGAGVGAISGDVGVGEGAAYGAAIGAVAGLIFGAESQARYGEPRYSAPQYGGAGYNTQTGYYPAQGTNYGYTRHGQYGQAAGAAPGAYPHGHAAPSATRYFEPSTNRYYHHDPRTGQRVYHTGR